MVKFLLKKNINNLFVSFKILIYNLYNSNFFRRSFGLTHLIWNYSTINDLKELDQNYTDKELNLEGKKKKIITLILFHLIKLSYVDGLRIHHKRKCLHSQHRQFS